MNMMSFVNEVIARTINKLRDIYTSKDGQKYVPAHPSSRLVFPTYREKGVRVSEQELRFLFVDEFNCYCNEKKIDDIFYSVETPTEDKYTFSQDGNKIPPIIGEGQSGNFDLTLLNNRKGKEWLIEFKAGYVTEQAFMEVLAKLSNPEETGIHRLIVHLVEDTISDTCQKNLQKATSWLYKNSNLTDRANVVYMCVSLTGNMELIRTTIEGIYNNANKVEEQHTQTLSEFFEQYLHKK